MKIEMIANPKAKNPYQRYGIMAIGDTFPEVKLVASSILGAIGQNAL